MASGPGRQTAAPAAASALAIAVVVGCASSTGPGPGPSPSAQTVVATISLSTTPGTPAVTPRAVYVPEMAYGTISAIDPRTNKVVQMLTVGDPSVRVAAGCGAATVHEVPINSFEVRRCDIPSAVVYGQGLWTLKNSDASVVSIDEGAAAGSARLTTAISVGGQPWGVCPSPDAVWVTDYQNDLLVRIDPKTQRVLAKLGDHLIQGPTGVVDGLGAVWVAGSRANVLARIDRDSDKLVTTIPVGLRPLAVTTAFGSVWVRNTRGNSLSRIDPATNKVIADVPVAIPEGRDGVDGLGVDGTGLWVSGLRVKHVSAATNQVDVTLPQDAVTLAYGDGSLWLVRIFGELDRLDVGTPPSTGG